MIEVNNNNQKINPFARKKNIEIVAVMNKGSKGGWTIYMQRIGDDTTRSYICQAFSAEARDYRIRVAKQNLGLN